jgi:NitT/TauT family transport system permease protein
MSMSGGWFFVVASEAISVGSVQVALPGVGSYVAAAIERHDIAAVAWAIAAMTVAIVVCDQLLFRPMVGWADKFRCEQSVSQAPPRSWVLDLLRRSPLVQGMLRPLGSALSRAARLSMAMVHPLRIPWSGGAASRLVDAAWYALIACAVIAMAWRIGAYIRPVLSWSDLRVVLDNGGLTFLRVAVLIVLASIIWVPIGVAIGLRPALTQRLQPVAQFLAAFPANLLFPLAVFLIVHFRLAPKLWLSPLMILGTQWYILFNVIAGASAFPGDFRDAAASFRVRPWHWWVKVMLPGIFPYYVTGAITASGGAWNASIVAEAVDWGSTHLSASGLGAYIAEQTAAGDYPRIALGIAVMSVLVIVTNRLLWRPLYALAERRTRLD